MSSLHAGIAALIVLASSLNVDTAHQFVVFPNFYLPIDKEDLEFTDVDKASKFALNMNMIPASAPQFNMTTTFVWDVYKDVLNNKRLPAPAAGGQGFAREFVEATAQLGSPEMTPMEVEFYSTSIVPVDLDDTAAWTPVVLDREAISRLAPQLREDHQAWLARFRLLPQLGDRFLEAISMEMLTLAILRPWLDQRVFTWRFWDLPGPIISDGNDLPRGRLPSVITKVVLVRNLRLKLAASLLPDVGSSIMLRRVEATGPGSAEMSLEPVAQLHRLSGADSTVTRHAMRSRNFQQLQGPIAGHIEALKIELAREIGASDTPDPAALAASGGFQRFHVPFSFDTQQAREHTSAALTAATATHAAKEAELGAARNKLQELMQTKLQWQTTPPLQRFKTNGHLNESYTVVNKRLIAELEQNLAQQQTLIGAKEQELAHAQAEGTRIRNSLSIIEQLAAIRVDPQAYVLALVCDRTPKSPNPDPSLITPP